MKRFFYASAAVLMLAIAYHLGAGSASAQFGSATNGFTIEGGMVYVMTNNGEVYRRLIGAGEVFSQPAELVGNFWSGGPTPALHESWGQLKSRYAPKAGTISKGTDTR